MWGRESRGARCLDENWSWGGGAEIDSSSVQWMGIKKKKTQSLQLECKLALKKPHASLNIFKNAR